MSDKPATPSQIGYAIHLVKQLGEKHTEKQIKRMNQREISDLISALKDKRGKPLWYGDGTFMGWDKKEHKINIKKIAQEIYHAQEKNYTCGPASLRMALDSIGIKKTEKELSKLLNTKENGTNTKAFPPVADYLNLKYTTEKNSSIEKLNSLINSHVIIVNLMPEDFGHYAVIKNMDDKKIKLLDPWYGPDSTYKISNFEKIWHSDPEQEKTVKWFFAIKKNANR